MSLISIFTIFKSVLIAFNYVILRIVNIVFYTLFFHLFAFTGSICHKNGQLFVIKLKSLKKIRFFFFGEWKI